MPLQTRKLLLIAGIPGTQQVVCGKLLAQRYGFCHYDLGDSENLRRLLANLPEFIDSILKGEGPVVVTREFLSGRHQIRVIDAFKARGFKLIWFDGNRPAALRAFIYSGLPSEELFYAQMLRIEESRVIEAINPFVIDPFERNYEFKTPGKILKEIEKAA